MLKNDVNSQIDDYYSLFNLKEDFKKTELEQAYNNEVEKLNNNLSIGVESRLQLMALFNTAFDTLNDSNSKSEYDREYKLHAEQLQASKLKSE
jgi:DnaJ-class molecular chaperone